MSLTVGSLLKERGEQLKLELVTGEKSLQRNITVSELNRPGLALIGFSEGFRAERIQIMGVGEQAYCLKAPPAELAATLAAMLATAELPCLVMSRNLKMKTPAALMQACRK